MAISPDENLSAEIIRRARQGDRSAFETIVRRYQRTIRAWVAAHCPPGRDVDDVAQRTFLAAFARIAEFEEDTDFRAWLFAIARFQLLTEITRLRRLADYHTRHAPDLLSRELERRAQEPDEKTEARLHYLRECLAAVGEQGRQFITWRYTDELPLQEMSNRAGRSVAAIKKQLWLLRQKLQQCIVYTLWYFEPREQPCLQIQYGMDLDRKIINPPRWAGVFRKAADGKSYTLECAIPWSLLGAGDDPPRAGDELGLCWIVNWSDASGRRWRGQLIEDKNPAYAGRGEKFLTFVFADTWGKAIYK